MLDLEELLTLDQAHAYLVERGVAVKPGTLRVWINRKHLEVAQRDHNGRPRVTILALARAEHATRKHARRTLATAA